MSREIINVGAVPNDGTGDPLRTAYIKCNNNFGEIYSRVQPTPPSTLVGTAGDTAGMYAYDQQYFYYCFQDYDGSSTIWGQISDTGVPQQVVNGNSNVKVYSNSTINISSAGVSNVAVFSSTGLELTGTFSAAGNTTVGNLSTSGRISATGNISTSGNLTLGATLFGVTGNFSGSVNGANLTATGNAIVTGNISGGNLSITTAVRTATVSASGNITGGNIGTAGRVSATGNVQGAYIIGDGSLLTNITAASNVAVTQIANGTSIITLAESGGSATFQVGGVANVLVVSAAGEYITGFSSVTGNVVGGNIVTSAIVQGATVSATGNVVGGNVNSSTVSASGNITGGNLITGGAVSSTGNINTTGNLVATANVHAAGYYGGRISVTGSINGANLVGTGYLSASGNIIAGNYFVGNGAFMTGVVATGVGTLGNLAVTGNANVGNLYANVVSATGNVTGNYILGNGALLTGVITSVANINLGTSNVTVTSSGGNIAVGIGGTSNVAVWATTGEYVTGVVSASGNITGGNILTGGLISSAGNISSGANLIINGLGTVQGNITGGNLNAVGLSLSGNVVSAFNVTGNITGGNLNTDGQAVVTGNITGGNLNTAGTVSTPSITKTGSNAVGNIGSSTSYFNTVFAQATSALYADVAEYYTADAEYPPGTVLKFGGVCELTICDRAHDPLIAGIVSEHPAFIMNSGLVGDIVVPLALTGRVKCKVLGPIARGQMMVSAGNGYAQAELSPAMGTVIGKAVEDFNGNVGEIEIVVGRL